MARLNRSNANNALLSIAIFGLLLMFWLGALYYSDSFFSPYVFYAIVGAISTIENIKNGNKMPAISKVLIVLFSAFFALAIVAANYNLISPFNAKRIILAGILLATGYLIAKNTLIWALNRKTGLNEHYICNVGNKAKYVFLTTFIFIFAIDVICLVFCSWPGIVSIDSLYQIEQVLHVRAFSNHHPFFHTMIIKICIDLGMALFGNINSGVAIYSILQILCMAGIFAFVLTTLYQAGLSKGWISVALMAYVLMPYHILYSITMWKDVLFGGVCILFICALYRIIKDIGSKRTNYVAMFFGAAGTCLLRSNGYLALLLTFFVLIVLLGKEHKKLLLTLLVVLVVTFFMKHGLLKILDVSQPDTAEFLSIPEQQIARLIVEGVDMTEDDIWQINKIMDINQVKTDYLPYISDPIKTIVRNTGQEYLNDHKGDYLKLYIRLAFKYPGIYIKAWIDQTKGYWNGGYPYWVAENGIVDNDYGLQAALGNNLISKIMNKWFGFFLYNNTFKLFISIGLHVWIIILSMVIMIIEKRKESVICVLLLALILTLLVSTPVFSEFRYAYAVFTSFPFVVLITFAAHGSAESPVDVKRA